MNIPCLSASEFYSTDTLHVLVRTNNDLNVLNPLMLSSKPFFKISQFKKGYNIV